MPERESKNPLEVYLKKIEDPEKRNKDFDSLLLSYTNKDQKNDLFKRSTGLSQEDIKYILEHCYSGDPLVEEVLQNSAEEK